MSKFELLAKIELLNKYEAMIEEMKGEADSIRNSIKAEMEAREVEELIAGQYIVRYTSVLSNRFQEGNAGNLQGLHQADFQPPLHHQRIKGGAKSPATKRRDSHGLWIFQM